MISRRRAPIALRRPISNVRSLTVTSMMFITTIPPTTSEIRVIGRDHHRDRARELVDARC